ncbi:MAG: tRNA (adenosine(37)-N6)-threonylcarbamoyltransferase complex ATPase subunit type 1 TsaE [Candidatus Krumholzibacteriia bacterium]
MRSVSEEETERFAATLGSRIEGGTCISLTGPLGSGKSVVARGICAGLGVEEPVISPTFILVEEYTGRLPVVHCDLYRLEHERDLEELGVFERIGNDAVVLVEWGDRSPRIYEQADVVISLGVTGATERRIDARYRSWAGGLFGER